MFFLRNFDTTDEINGFVSSGNTVAFLGDKRKKVVYASNNNVVRANDEYVDLRSENSLKYLTFEALEDNSGVCIFKRKDPTIERTINLQYSLDSGETWSSYTMPDANASGATISLSKGQSVMFKGNNPEGYNETYWDNSKLQIKLAHQFKCCGICKLYGNVMSLIYDDNFIDKTEIPNNGSFGMLFAANTGITEAVITFPENYNSKKMGYSIFVNCPNLNTIVFECGDFQDAVYFANLDSKLNVCHLNMRLNNCTSCYFMFNQCSGLTSLDLSKWDTSNVTNMGYMFSECSGLTSIGDLSKWNTSNVTDMQAMFQACSGLTSVGDLSNWKTSGVTNMGYMFNKCHDLTSVGDLSNWNTSGVTNMGYMFNKCHDLTSLDLSKWDTSNVTNMLAMFNQCYGLTSLDLSNWKTSGVTDMQAMFNQCSGLTSVGDLSNWKTSGVTNMGYMFFQCYGLTSLDLSKWDTSNVTNMLAMFYQCSGLTSVGDLSNWNTSNVTNMQAMFNQCYGLTSLDLSNWKTSGVTNMHAMFYQCSGLTSVGDLSNWNTSGVTNMCAMFNRCHLLKQELDVSNWDVSKVTSLEMTFNTTRLALKGVSKWNVSGVTNMHATFRRCIETDPDELDFSKWDTSKVTNMTQMFANQEMGDDDADCPQEILDWSLTRIKHLPAIPTGCTTSNMFKNDYKLTTINGANTISASVSFEDCPLTHDSALVIINALDSTVSSCSIVFSKSTYATLSEAEIKIGTDKGWSISQI
jgi:surface protein